MGLDVYDIKRLAKELPEILIDYKIVQTTRTTILKADNATEPTGHETTVEYSLKRK